MLLELLLVFNIIVSGATGDSSTGFLGKDSKNGIGLAEKERRTNGEQLSEEERNAKMTKERNLEHFQRFLEENKDEQPPFPWDLMIYCVIIWMLTLWCFLYCTTCGKKARGIIPLNEEDEEAFEIASDLASQKSKMKSNATASTEKSSQDLGSDFPPTDDDKNSKGSKGPNATTEFVISGKYKKPDIGANENFKKAGISEAELAQVK